MNSCVFDVSPEDIPESPPGPGSPKIALLPPVLKRVPSDKEKDGQSSPQPAIRSLSQEGKHVEPFVQSPPPFLFFTVHSLIGNWPLSLLPLLTESAINVYYVPA